MKDFFKDKKILITGHTGFQGSWLSYTLTNWGADVVGISLPMTGKHSMFEALDLEKKIKHSIVDIRNFEKLNDLIQEHQPEIVFHLAAQALVRPSYENPLETYSSNVIGTANLLEALRNSKTVKSAVIITTDKVYANLEQEIAYKEEDALGGYDPYSASKAAADITTQSYIQSFFNPEKPDAGHEALIAIARSGNVIGGGDWGEYRLIPDIIKAIYEDDQEIIIRNPNAIRPWQHVLEPLNGYMILAKKLFQGEKEIVGAWNFGPEDQESCSVEELVKKAISTSQKGSYKIIPDKKRHEAGILRLDIGKAKEKLAWSPKLNLEETLRLTMDWYRDFYEDENIKNTTKKQIDLFFNSNN